MVSPLSSAEPSSSFVLSSALPSPSPSPSPVSVVAPQPAGAAASSSALPLAKSHPDLVFESGARVLVVGDGDLTFSRILMEGQQHAAHVQCSILDTASALQAKYSFLDNTLAAIRARGGEVLFEVDATKLHTDERFPHSHYDRVIFNFPYNIQHQLEANHASLVERFLASAPAILRDDGMILLSLHVGKKEGVQFDNWRVQDMLRRLNLVLVRKVPLKAKYLQTTDPSGRTVRYTSRCSDGRPFKIAVAFTYFIGLRETRHTNPKHFIVDDADASFAMGTPQMLTLGFGARPTPTSRPEKRPTPKRRVTFALPNPLPTSHPNPRFSPPREPKPPPKKRGVSALIAELGLDEDPREVKRRKLALAKKQQEEKARKEREEQQRKEQRERWDFLPSVAANPERGKASSAGKRVEQTGGRVPKAREAKVDRPQPPPQPRKAPVPINVDSGSDGERSGEEDNTDGDDEESSDQEYGIEALVGRRLGLDGEELYLVKWVGFSHDDNTWEPRSHLIKEGCAHFIAQYEDHMRRLAAVGSEKGESDTPPPVQPEQAAQPPADVSQAQLEGVVESKGEGEGEALVVESRPQQQPQQQPQWASVGGEGGEGGEGGVVEGSAGSPSESSELRSQPQPQPQPQSSPLRARISLHPHPQPQPQQPPQPRAKPDPQPKPPLPSQGSLQQLPFRTTPQPPEPPAQALWRPRKLHQAQREAQQPGHRPLSKQAQPARQHPKKLSPPQRRTPQPEPQPEPERRDAGSEKSASARPGAVADRPRPARVLCVSDDEEEDEAPLNVKPVSGKGRSQEQHEEEEEESEEEDEYEVEAIVGRRKLSSGVKYLVKWKGWDEADNTWEPLSNLGSCMAMVREYDQRHPPKR